MSLELSPEAIRANAHKLRGHLRHTPVLEVDPADFGLSGDFRLILKLEFLQRSGSFKARGAFTALTRREVPPAGVVAASGGNHGAAVAFAAQALGIPAKIFVPAVSSPAKIEKIRSLGAELVVQGDRYDDALALARKDVVDRNALELHAFDQDEVLLGQGSVAVEFEEDSPEVDTYLVAVGGGGLIGGMAAYLRDRATLVAVEPLGAPTLNLALAQGAPTPAPTGSIAADSLAPVQVGERMFPWAKSYVNHSVLVSDAAIAEARRRLWEATRILAEPGAAVTMAALLERRFVPPEGAVVGALICGANTDSLPAPTSSKGGV